MYVSGIGYVYHFFCHLLDTQAHRSAIVTSYNRSPTTQASRAPRSHPFCPPSGDEHALQEEKGLEKLDSQCRSSPRTSRDQPATQRIEPTSAHLAVVVDIVRETVVFNVHSSDALRWKNFEYNDQRARDPRAISHAAGYEAQ
ncbi:hypothetical protein CSOJ01_02535 [Colletotrichum sojae]|uniref:Uncharacterized protein n=1 Tax=Colletotrichum sojae TaxID=2175907 RepID=A0A8H6N2J4_9PEZI|nr:hypothetical protein CSOJ01_02535 [Colletotrichum sojae]